MVNGCQILGKPILGRVLDLVLLAKCIDSLHVRDVRDWEWDKGARRGYEEEWLDCE